MTTKRKSIREDLANDKAAIAFLKFVSKKSKVLGHRVAQQFAVNALKSRIARIEHTKPIKITLAKYSAAIACARTRKDLARKLGVSLTAIRKFEKTRGISPTKTKRLATNL